ncbi:MAG TPA: GGDEF domain-containing protein [Abditibacteriaceae bacterium]|jgi:diguanylate cyclase (GGDEF)-like protein
MENNSELSTQHGTTQTLASPALDTQLEEQLCAQIETAHNTGNLLAVVSMELNNPDLFNDTPGTHGVDKVLHTVEECLQAVQSDGDITTRYGDAGFIALLPNSDAHDALEVCSRIAANIDKRPYQSSSGREIPIGLSFGAAIFPHDGNTLHDLLAVASSNLDEARRGSVSSN